LWRAGALACHGQPRAAGLHIFYEVGLSQTLFLVALEVTSLIGEIYRNEALAEETFFIHGGLRLGSKG